MAPKAARKNERKRDSQTKIPTPGEGAGPDPGPCRARAGRQDSQVVPSRAGGKKSADSRPRVLGYARVSTSEQDSIASQVAKIRMYAELHALDLVDVVVDHGKTAKTLDRPGIQRVLADLTSGAAAGVIVYKLDRLTRNLSDWSDLIETHFSTSGGIALMSVSESIDTSKAAGRMVLNLLVTVAQWERETIVERTLDKVEYLKANGRRTGQVPYGQLLTGDGPESKSGRPSSLTSSPRDLEALELIAELDAVGWSLRKIAQELNDRGFTTKNAGRINASGRRNPTGYWSPSTVGDLAKRLRAAKAPADAG